MTSVRNEINADFAAEQGGGCGGEDGRAYGEAVATGLHAEHVESQVGHGNGHRDHHASSVAHYRDIAAQCDGMATDVALIVGNGAPDMARECAQALRQRAEHLRNNGRDLRDYADGLRGRPMREDHAILPGHNGVGRPPGAPDDRGRRPSRDGANRQNGESASSNEVEIPLLGGDMTDGVVRVGETVRRPVRPHTAAVHALLRHLEAVGFDGAPRVLGIDEKNREVLTYLPGQVPRRPLPAYALADSTLVALAELQRRYHEAAAGFEPPPWARWDGEVTRQVDGPADVVCHCDINLENVIFREGPDGPRPYAFIDFDLARPGTRLVDIIQTLRYWAPIADPCDRDPALRDVNAGARIAVFCDAYGLSYIERARLVAVATRWLRRSPASIAQRARASGGAWTRMLEAGVGDRMVRAAAWLERNRPEIEARLRCSPGLLAK
jgi:hypothetical protein